MPTKTFYGPTYKQLGFYNTLAAERGLPKIGDFADGITRKQASEAIEALMKLPKTAQAKAADATPLPTVPDGLYALTAEDGATSFYKVNTGKAGSKWAGFTFVDRLDDHGKRVAPVKDKSVKVAVLNRIAADPLAASSLFGKKIGRCGVCGKTLTDPNSIEQGVGPVCIKKYGWA